MSRKPWNAATCNVLPHDFVRFRPQSATWQRHIARVAAELTLDENARPHVRGKVVSLSRPR